MPKAKKPLNHKNSPDQVKLRHEKFIAAYIRTQNATEAAKEAGYSHKTAHAQGCRLLKNVYVQHQIKSRAVAVMEKIDVTTEAVLRNQAIMAFSNMKNYINIDKHGRAEVSLDGLSDDQWAAVKTIKITSLPPMTIVENGQELEREVLKTEITLYDRLDANTTLMTHLGMLKAAQNPPSLQINNFNSMSDTELAKRVAFMLADPKLSGPVIDQPPAPPEEPETP